MIIVYWSLLLSQPYQKCSKSSNIGIHWKALFERNLMMSKSLVCLQNCKIYTNLWYLATSVNFRLNVAPLAIHQKFWKNSKLLPWWNGTFWFFLDYISEQKGHTMHPSVGLWLSPTEWWGPGPVYRLMGSPCTGYPGQTFNAIQCSSKQFKAFNIQLMLCFQP